MDRRRALLTASGVIPNNEVWYISGDGQIIKPYRTGVFGANIVSNTYANGKGVIVFDSAIIGVGSYAFYNRTQLINIVLPNGITSIGDSAFYACDNLTSVTIPNSVTSIGDSAFLGCYDLATITIPNSVTKIGITAFYSCSTLTDVICKPTTPPTGGYDMFAYISSNAKIYVPAGSGNAYKTAQYWSNYASKIVEQ